MSEVKTLSLFPLGVVLFPEMDLPLHIFEDRYKRMIRECIQQETEFGVVLLDGSRFLEVGCTAQVVHVLKRYEDGRMDILTRGRNRFRVQQVVQSQPCLEARVEFFDDEPEELTSELEGFAREGMDLLHQLSEIAEEPTRCSMGDNRDLKRISFALAGNPTFQLREKQQFMEMTSTGSRLRKCIQAMQKTLDRLRLTQEIEKIIHGNGRIPERLRSRYSR